MEEIINFITSGSIDAWVGVVGTLLGVISGFLLNWASQYGKIKFYQTSIAYQALSSDGMGGNVTDFEKPDYLSIILEFELFNTSSSNKKIWREISFTRVYKGDERGFRVNQGRDNELEFLSVDPRSINKYRVTIGVNEDIQIIHNSDWYLEYRNDRNCLNKIHIEKPDLEIDYPSSPTTSSTGT